MAERLTRREIIKLGLLAATHAASSWACMIGTQEVAKETEVPTPSPTPKPETPIYLSDQGLREEKPTTAEANQAFRDLVDKDLVLYLSLNSWRTGQPERVEVAGKEYYLIPLASRVTGNVTLPNILLDKAQYNNYTTYYWGFPRRAEYNSLFVEIPPRTTFEFKVIEVPVKGERKIVLSLKSVIPPK